MKQTIGIRLAVSFLVAALILTSLAIYSVLIGQQALKKAVGRSSVWMAEEMLKGMDLGIYDTIEQLQTHSKHLLLQNTILASNKAFDELDDIQKTIDQRGREWVAAPWDRTIPFMKEIVGNKLSDSLREEFIVFYEKEYGYRVIAEVSVTNKYGANVAQTGRTSDYRQDDEKLWQEARASGFSVGRVEYDESTAVHVIPVAARVDDRSGNFIGVMRAELDAKAVIRGAEISAKRFETTEIWLISGHKNLIYATEAYRFFEDAGKKPFYEKLGSDSGYFTVRLGGREKLFSYAHSKGYRGFKGLDWILVMAHDVEEILRPSAVIKRHIITAAIGLMALGLSIAFLLSLSITRPIGKLIEGTRRFGKGDLKYRIDIRTKDEIGRLAAAFNEMAEERQQAEEAIVKTKARLEYLLTSSPAVIYSCKPSGDYGATFISENVTSQLGYEPREFTENSGFWAAHIHPEDAPRVFAEMPRLFEKGFHTHEYRFRTGDGSYQWMHDELKLVLDESGEPLEIVGSWMDIDDRKQKEEEINRYTARLKAANKELKAFTYSVSHDLRAPLRAINSFSKILTEDHASRLDQEGKRVLNVISNNTQKMGQLIDNLLAFSRLDRKEIKRTHVDMNRLTDEIMRELKPLFEDRNVHFNVENLPDTWGDAAMFREVMINLIANALKFTRDRNPAVIEIDGKAEENENIYYIKDNGVGFNMKYADKLFNVFQRLHSSREFEGTGVGLAIVQRIVQKHGGRVWAEGEVDKGATFYFSLPGKEEPSELSE